MKNKWTEYKERKEAQNYFRQHNDMFLSSSQWIKTICAGILGAVIIGVVHGAITLRLSIDFSIFYLIIGYAIANIMTSVSGVSSNQVGIASAIITLFAFYVSRLLMFVLIIGFSSISMALAFQALFNSGILDLIFVVIGVFVAYQQAS